MMNDNNNINNVLSDVIDDDLGMNKQQQQKYYRQR